jgi:hypothetical protein
LEFGMIPICAVVGLFAGGAWGSGWLGLLLWDGVSVLAY